MFRRMRSVGLCLAWEGTCAVNVRSQPYRVELSVQARILVLASEDVISALLGAMVELYGYKPVFPVPSERPLDAAQRTRADLILLDCEDDLAWDADAIRSIGEWGSRVLLFSALRSQREVDEIADRHGISAFALPLPFRDFAARLGQVLPARAS